MNYQIKIFYGFSKNFFNYAKEEANKLSGAKIQKILMIERIYLDEFSISG